MQSNGGIMSTTTARKFPVRTALSGGAMGGRLLFLAPKQATFQIERQVVSGEGVGGFTRLEILSFERFAQKVVEERSGVVKRLGEVMMP